jgi:hypothetical protein
MDGCVPGAADDLARIALEALPALWDPRSGLFVHKTVLARGDYDNRGSNAFYSAIALAGILEQQITPADRLVPLGEALDALYAALASSRHPAPLGVGVWASSLAGDPRGEQLTNLLCGALESTGWSSMELGLGLSGLVAAFGAYPSARDRCARLARSTAAALLERFSPRADLFRGSRRTSARNATRPYLTSFASQVYPLHGLAQFTRAIGQHPPQELSHVAGKLLDLQGPLGQWWWFYSTRSGRVLEGYPVYSVHQDGMAFMALAPLRELGVRVAPEALLRGLRWVSGENELGVGLARDDPPFIARCIQRAGSDPDGFGGISRSNRLRVAARSLVPGRRDDVVAADTRTLEVLEECRPYHLGWLLYATRLMDGLERDDG